MFVRVPRSFQDLDNGKTFRIMKLVKSGLRDALSLPIISSQAEVAHGPFCFWHHRVEEKFSSEES